MVKSIIKRIIVGVGIALCIMAIKGSLIANVSAMETNVFSLNSQRYFDGSWHNPTTVNTNHFGFGFIGYNFTGNLSRSEYHLNLNNSSLTGKRINLNFFLYYSNIEGDGTTPTVSINGHYAEVSQAGYYKSFSSTSNITGFAYSDSGSGVHPVYFYIDGVLMGTGSSTDAELEIDHNTVPLYIVQFKDIYISDASDVQLDVLTVWTSGKATNEYTVGLRYYYDTSTSSAILEENQKQTEATENINNSINDSSTDDPSSDITDMNDKIATNNSISQLLTLPIQLYQNILNSLNGSCSSFSLGSLYNHSLTLPCINLQSLLGSTLFNIIDILISGLFILSFRKKMVDIFNHMTSLNDRGNELE